MRRLLASAVGLALTLALLPPPVLAAAPANDNVADAIMLAGPSGSISSTTVDATLETDEAIWLGSGQDHSVWYRWSAGRKNVVVTFTTCGGATWDTYLQAYRLPVTTPSWPYFENVTTNDDVLTEDCFRQSRIEFLAEAGQTYWIRLTGFDTAAFGPYTLAWTTEPTVRGTLGITVTNTQGDPASCTLNIKGSGLLPDQEVLVATSPGAFAASVFTVAGRWTADPQILPRADWNAETAGALDLAYSITSADGYSWASVKFTNRCQPALP